MAANVLHRSNWGDIMINKRLRRSAVCGGLLREILMSCNVCHKNKQSRAKHRFDDGSLAVFVTRWMDACEIWNLSLCLPRPPG